MWITEINILRNSHQLDEGGQYLLKIGDQKGKTQVIKSPINRVNKIKLDIFLVKIICVIFRRTYYYHFEELWWI